MIDEFRELNFSNTTILDVQTRNGDVVVNLKDSQEKKIVLLFHEVMGFESFQPVGVLLRHVTANADDQFIEWTCDLTQSDKEGAACFRFWAPGYDRSILTVVARAFELTN